MPNLSSQNAPNGVMPVQRGIACFWLVVCQCDWDAARNSSALSRTESIPRRMDLWALDHGSHESGTLRMGESSLGGFPSSRSYGADREPFAQWCRPVLWVWSAALGVGAYSWLSGHSSGKLFLDWSGYARIFFPLAMLALWLLLALAFVRGSKSATNTTLPARSAKIFALAFATDCSIPDISRVRSVLLSGHQSRYRRPHRRKPARVFADHCRDSLDASLRPDPAQMHAAPKRL